MKKINSSILSSKILHNHHHDHNRHSSNTDLDSDSDSSPILFMPNDDDSDQQEQQENEEQDETKQNEYSTDSDDPNERTAMANMWFKMFNSVLEFQLHNKNKTFLKITPRQMINIIDHFIHKQIKIIV